VELFKIKTEVFSDPDEAFEWLLQQGDGKK
jgi:hypothetical protein